MKQKEIAEHHQKRILECLVTGEKDWKTLKELTGFTDRTLAKHLKRLEEKGFIESKIDKKDRRKKIYKATLLGLEKIIDDLIVYAYFKSLKKASPRNIFLLFFNSILEGHLTMFLKALKIYGKIFERFLPEIYGEVELNRIRGLIKKEIKVLDIKVKDLVSEIENIAFYLSIEKNDWRKIFEAIELLDPEKKDKIGNTLEFKDVQDIYDVYAKILAEELFILSLILKQQHSETV